MTPHPQGGLAQLKARIVDLQREPERGDISYWVIMSVLVAFLLCLLLVDGSAKRQANTQAHWYAAEAARAGINAAGPRYAMNGQNAGPGAAAAAVAARAYLARIGVDGTVTVKSPTQVQVTATVTRVGPMSHHAFVSTESATADLLVGVQNGMKP